jgi:hypothetical protein
MERVVMSWLTVMFLIFSTACFGKFKYYPKILLSEQVGVSLEELGKMREKYPDLSFSEIYEKVLTKKRAAPEKKLPSQTKHEHQD